MATHDHLGQVRTRNQSLRGITVSPTTDQISFHQTKLYVGKESDRHKVQDTYLQDKQLLKQDLSEEKPTKDNDSRGKSTKVDISEEELDAIRRVIQNMRREKKDKADLFSITSACSEPSPQAVLTHSPEVEAEEIYLDPCEPEPALLSNEVMTVQSNSPEQNLSQLTPPSVVLVVQLTQKMILPRRTP
ncbi:hypothetical protein ABVT39_016261 [Epinephelus coioides]